MTEGLRSLELNIFYDLYKTIPLSIFGSGITFTVDINILTNIDC